MTEAAPPDASGVRGPPMPVPEGATLTGLVEARVARGPDAVAVVHGGHTLSYAELDRRANRLAHHLRALGVGRDVPVGVCLRRGAELAVAVLGVLKAGGACLPLDHTYPPQRLAFMLAEAAPPVLLTLDDVAGRLPAYPGVVVRLDRDWPAVAARPAGAPAAGTRPDDLAYVLYTSGSTGQPKGVMLSHRGLVNHNLAVSRLYRLGPGDRVVQFCSLGFDVSVEETLPTWASGGAVVFRPDDLPILGTAWLDWLRGARATVLNLPTAYWHEWVRDLEALGAQVPESIRLVVVGGEKALGSAYRRWLEVGGRRVRWINAYGPAEASVLATSYEPPEVGAGPVDRDPPIGRPLANTTVRILDRRGAPVAPGEAGDLHIGGLGLARGYLASPALTAERFVPDRFADRPGARLYRTGDLVRLRPDGELEFCGRVDEQVKIRGFRVECGEVERALARHPAVAEAVVVAREDEPGDRRLVAYVVAAAGAAPTAVELRRFLSERLPAAMLPSAFVALERLPLTPNGKVDRDALPPPGEPRRDLPTAWVAPRSPTEQAVAAIWSRVLRVSGLGADDDFFELGGHSLQAIQVIAEARDRLGVELGVDALFEAQTVARLAAAVDEQRRTRPGPGDGDVTPPLVRQARRPGARAPLTLSQEQMWRLETTAEPPGLYNVTAMRRFGAPVDADALRAALSHVVDRHEALRTAVHGDAAGTPWQSVASGLAVELAVCDLAGVVEDRRDAELPARIAAQDAEPFTLAEPPLLRACLYRGGDDDVLAATFDHLVCDGTSAYVFLSELAAAYEAVVAGRQPALRPLAVQYPDFALWQRRWLTEERLQAQIEYWRGKLAGMPLGPALPFDRLPQIPTRRIRSRPLTVSARRYGALQRLARATRSTVFVLAVAAVQALLARLGGTDDVVLSTTLSGRGRAELEGLIGCFHGVGRIRTDLSGDPPFTAVVARARDSVVGLLEHSDVPFMRVRRVVLPDFPGGGLPLLSAVPVDFQYFHTAHDEWAPGTGVVERPGPDKGPDELFFRGQLHPLSVTFLDDGAQLWGEARYKADFYDDDTIERLADGLDRLIAAVSADPGLALSQLPVDA